MSDEQIFPAFKPAPQTTVSPEVFREFNKGATPKEPKGKRQRKVKAVNEAPAEKPAKAPRKKRAVPKVRLPKESAGMKVSIETALSALGSLKQEDAAVFEKVAGILNAAGSSQRARVLDALGKVFA